LKSIYGSKISFSDRCPVKQHVEKLYQTSERLQGKLSEDSYTFGKEEGAAICFIQDLYKICGEATANMRKKSEPREIVQMEEKPARQMSVAVREVKKANPKAKTAKGEVTREFLQPETADSLTFEMPEPNQAQLSVAPKQKR
jgi:hypothetical protein